MWKGRGESQEDEVGKRRELEDSDGLEGSGAEVARYMEGKRSEPGRCRRETGAKM